MYGSMRSNARYAEASALFHRHVVRQWRHLFNRDHCELRRRPERSIGLGAVAPYRTPHPLRVHAWTHLVYSTSAITVWNDARICHSVPKGVLTLLNIAWIDPRGSNANANFSSRGTWVRNLSHCQHLASWPLFLVPSCLH